MCKHMRRLAVIVVALPAAFLACDKSSPTEPTPVPAPSVLQQSDPLTCGSATQDRCVWSAESDAAWITVTTSMPQIGDQSVSFTVAENTSASPRTGTITVRDRSVRVTQAGP